MPEREDPEELLRKLMKRREINPMLRFLMFSCWERGHDRNVATFEERQEKIAYIHKNPVTRGLVKNREDWKWSSYRWYMGERSGVVSLDL